MELQLVQVPAHRAVHSRDPFLWPEWHWLSLRPRVVDALPR